MTALLGLFLFVLSLANAENAPYNETFARHRMFPVASAAYSDEPELCLGRTFSNFSVVQKMKLACDSWNNPCAAYAAVNHDDRAILLAFRGTQGIEQLVVEIAHMTTDSLQPFVGGGKVGAYFKNAFEAVWNNGTLEAFNAIRKEHPDYELWVTGHSLGGSMASLAALYIAHLSLFDASKMRLMTFGQPRTGNSDYTEAVDYNLPYSYRVVHLRDIVPHIPPTFFGYAHHQEEIFYPNDMKDGAAFQECPGDENSKCSDDWTNESIMDHLWYFDHQFSHYGESGCTKQIENTNWMINRQTKRTKEEEVILAEVERIVIFDKHQKAVVKTL